MTDLERRAQKVREVLEDQEWTANVVRAAVVAHDVLQGPPTTADGDQASMVARSTLNAALTDLRAIQALNEADWKGEVA
jgi:hypothetical protein